jgi:hypothetical protein
MPWTTGCGSGCWRRPARSPAPTCPKPTSTASAADTPTTTATSPGGPSRTCTGRAPGAGSRACTASATTCGRRWSGPRARAGTRRCWSGSAKASGTTGTCGARAAKACAGCTPGSPWSARTGERRALLSAAALLHLGRAEFDQTEALAHEQRQLAVAARDRAAEGDALGLATVAWRAGGSTGPSSSTRTGSPPRWPVATSGARRWRRPSWRELHRDRREPDAARVLADRATAHADRVGELARGLARDVAASIEHRGVTAPCEAARRGGPGALPARGLPGG